MAHRDKLRSGRYVLNQAHLVDVEVSRTKITAKFLARVEVDLFDVQKNREGWSVKYCLFGKEYSGTLTSPPKSEKAPP